MSQKALYPLGVWMGMAAVAVMNGIGRELVISPRVGNHLGHITSTIMLTVVILVITFLFFSRVEIAYSNYELLVIGMVWSVLTITFVFIIGYLEETPPRSVLEQYNVLSGSIWVIVPITLLFVPLVFGSKAHEE
jgi:hypothetical protein